MPSWFTASQMQALNPLLVMILIPFNNLVLYPALRRFGFEPTALRRMTAGIAFSGLAWIVVGGIQVVMDGGNAMSIFWQMLPYALLTFGEVLVSATGLEVRLQPGAAGDEGRGDELLEPDHHHRQPVGAAVQRGGAQRHGDPPDRRYRAERGGVPDVLLRRFRLRRGVGLRLVRETLSYGRQLP
jgi:hypothetical protein